MSVRLPPGGSAATARAGRRSRPRWRPGLRHAGRRRAPPRRQGRSSTERCRPAVGPCSRAPPEGSEGALYPSPERRGRGRYEGGSAHRARRRRPIRHLSRRTCPPFPSGPATLRRCLQACAFPSSPNPPIPIGPPIPIDTPGSLDPPSPINPPDPIRAGGQRNRGISPPASPEPGKNPSGEVKPITASLHDQSGPTGSVRIASGISSSWAKGIALSASSLRDGGEEETG